MSRTHLVLAVSCSLAACSQGGPISSAPSEVVFHTSASMLSGHLSDLGADAGDARNRLRERVKQFFPAACLDSDSDHDGVPDSCDHGMDNEPAQVGEHDGGGDDDESLRCQRCNRGPGNSGDFRYEERGTQARLDRGRIVSRTDATLVIAGPNGPITIEVSPTTEIDASHGAATPGAEVRAEGTLRQGATRTIEATKLEVLCPGPGVVPVASLPTEVPLAPVPATDRIN